MPSKQSARWIVVLVAFAVAALVYGHDAERYCASDLVLLCARTVVLHISAIAAIAIASIVYNEQRR